MSLSIIFFDFSLFLHAHIDVRMFTYDFNYIYIYILLYNIWWDMAMLVPSKFLYSYLCANLGSQWNRCSVNYMYKKTYPIFFLFTYFISLCYPLSALPIPIAFSSTLNITYNKEYHIYLSYFIFNVYFVIIYTHF